MKRNKKKNLVELAIGLASLKERGLKRESTFASNGSTKTLENGNERLDSEIVGVPLSWALPATSNTP